MDAQISAAVIGGVAGLTTSLLALIVDHRRRKAELANLQAELQRREIDKKRLEYETALKEFLDPFERLLEQNEEMHQNLLGPRGALEYHPKALKAFFGGLPYKDRRKRYWLPRINRLRANNRQMVALLMQHGSRMLTDGFRDACAEFQYHAHEWEDVWKAAMSAGLYPGEEEWDDGEPVPGDQIVERGEAAPDTLYANRFPARLRKALESELSEVRRRIAELPEIVSHPADATQRGVAPGTPATQGRR